MPGPEARAAVERSELEAWRRATFDRIHRWSSAVAVVVYGLIWLSGGQAPELLLYYSVLLLLPAVYLVRRWLPFRARAGGFMAVTFGISLVSFGLIGFTPNISLLFVLSAVVGAIWLGPRAAMAVAVASVVIVWLAISYRVWTGWTPPMHDLLHGDAVNLVRMASSYSALSLLVIGSVAYAIAMVERQARARADALVKLRSEVEHRSTVEDARRQAEQALVQSQKLELVGRMASGVSHDFNNALTVILTWAEILKRNPGRDLSDGLEAIRQAGLSSAQMTRRLLVLGRHAPRELKPIALDHHLAELGRTIERLLPENIALRVESGDVPLVLADSGELDQAVLNLALNARDAMPDGGSLEIRTLRGTPAGAEPRATAAPPARGWVGIRVADTGTGMDEATRARLFEPFFTTKGSRGTGLGLASVRAITDAAGGRVEIDSAPGAGTRITLWLPARPEAAIADATPMGTPIVRKATILLVEDDAALRKVMSAALRGAGHEVLDASNAESALEIARRMRGEISLLCTDCIMPGPGVRHLIDSFRELYPSAPVLLCSGYLSPDVPAPEELGAAFLPKPFEASTLQLKVAELLLAQHLDRSADSARA